MVFALLEPDMMDRELTATTFGMITRAVGTLVKESAIAGTIFFRVLLEAYFRERCTNYLPYEYFDYRESLYSGRAELLTNTV